MLPAPRSVSRGALGALIVALAQAVAAQDRAQPAPPTFQSGVQLVEVDVRVFDADGRFVGDLAREDFELVDSGAPQAIESLHAVGVDGAPVEAPPIHGVSPSRSPAPVAPQTWIFFFDLNHLSPGGGFDRARKAVEDFVRDRFRDGDLAGVVAGERMVNNRITSVKRELLDAVTQVKPRGGNRTRLLELTREWPRLLDFEEAIRIARNEADAVARAVGRACNDDPEYCERGDPEAPVRAKGIRIQQEAHRSATQTLSAINGLASGLSRMPGPKTVVFLSDGFVSQDLESTVRSVVGQATRAGARVYAIDVRGLNRTANPGIIDQELAADVFDAGRTFDGFADGANSLAVDSGGLMVRNENNIGRALGKVAEDSGRYYVLVYQPSNPALDGTYRPIEVKVKRRGLRVRARRGYLALPPARMLLPQPVPTTTEPGAAIDRAPDDTVPADPPKPRGAIAEPSPASPAKPAAPPENVATTAGTTVAPTAAPATSVRLRPDAAGRVAALSKKESQAAGEFAAEGWQAYQRGDVETAHAAFLKAAGDPAVRPWVLYALGMSQAALGQAQAAIASWERVRAAVPDFQPVYMDLADAYAAMADLTSALATVRQAEARWPDSADVHSAIGVILVRRGALDDGIRSLIKTTELNPRDDLAYLNLGRAYALRYQRNRRYVTSQQRWVAPEGDRTKAIEALQRVVQLGGPYAARAKEELTLLEWSQP